MSCPTGKGFKCSTRIVLLLMNTEPPNTGLRGLLAAQPHLSHCPLYPCSSPTGLPAALQTPGLDWHLGLCTLLALGLEHSLLVAYRSYSSSLCSDAISLMPAPPHPTLTPCLLTLLCFS